jgi:hypothetical protein
MTMPDERRNAVNRTRIFLMDLMDPKKTPRVPSAIRKEAASCLRHYPGEYYMSKASEQAPELFGDWDDYYVKGEQVLSPFGDGNWDANIIHDDG